MLRLLPLTRPSFPKITSAAANDNRVSSERRTPRRDELERAALRVLKAGGRTKADLAVVDIGQGPLVVKDFAGKAWWVRLVGRLQIARECRAYRWLGPLPGLPRFIGRVDAHALALDWIDGVELFRVLDRLEDGAAVFSRLRRSWTACTGRVSRTSTSGAVRTCCWTTTAGSTSSTWRAPSGSGRPGCPGACSPAGSS